MRINIKSICVELMFRANGRLLNQQQQQYLSDLW